MGVTIFARTDAHVSQRNRLVAGFAVLIGGIALLAGVPLLTNERPPLEILWFGWLLMWVTVGIIIARRCILAILDPSPSRVQAAVWHCVQSVIVLDAVVCAGYVGPYWGFVVLTFLIPTYLLTMWLNAT